MKTFKLTKETDPRELEYWKKIFPKASKEELEFRRNRWIRKNIKP